MMNQLITPCTVFSGLQNEVWKSIDPTHTSLLLKLPQKTSQTHCYEYIMFLSSSDVGEAQKPDRKC